LSTDLYLDWDLDTDTDTETDDTAITTIDLTDLPELELFLDEGFISGVVRELKSGKEATAYCCIAGPSAAMEPGALLVAKRYRPIDTRGFKNDSIYQSGRWAAADKRTVRAFEQKSRFGREAQFSTWVEHEYRTLTMLHAAGCDVPRPIIKSTEVILMEYFGDEDAPAPLLQQARPSRDEARALFDRLMWNVEVMLSHDRVHGDLSAFNILYWDGRAVIIDFPQAVDPQINPSAHVLLERDITNLCTHFRRLGVHADPDRIAGDMWMRYRFGALGMR
jgi:RIO kinase 1